MSREYCMHAPHLDNSQRKNAFGTYIVQCLLSSKFPPHHISQRLVLGLAKVKRVECASCSIFELYSVGGIPATKNDLFGLSTTTFERLSKGCLISVYFLDASPRTNAVFSCLVPCLSIMIKIRQTTDDCWPIPSKLATAGSQLDWRCFLATIAVALAAKTKPSVKAPVLVKNCAMWAFACWNTTLSSLQCTNHRAVSPVRIHRRHNTVLAIPTCILQPVDLADLSLTDVYTLALY